MLKPILLATLVLLPCFTLAQDAPEENPPAAEEPSQADPAQAAPGPGAEDPPQPSQDAPSEPAGGESTGDDSKPAEAETGDVMKSFEDDGAAEGEADGKVLSRLTFLYENDKFAGTDRFYTNGIKGAYQRTDVGAVSAFFNDAINLIPFARAKPLSYGFVVGQDIYTPEDTEETRLIPNDRPYSGWLYGGVTLTRGNSPREGAPKLDPGTALFQDRIEILFGVIGVDALGRQMQNNVHETINVATAKGWRNQLRSEPGFEIYSQRKWLLKVWPNSGWLPGSDFLPHVGFALGHPFTHFSIGGTFRLGWNLGEDFGPVQRIASAGFDRPRKTEGVQFYFFARVEGRLVGWNAFVQGNLFHTKRRRLSSRGVIEDHDIEVERFVADFELGAVLQLWRFEIGYTHAFRTREFEEQQDSFIFGAVHASITW